MKNPLGFIVDLFKQPTWVVMWVSALVLVNLASIAFFEFILAKAILGIFIFQAIVMMAMYSYFGFEKILGLAHLLWVPLLGYILLVIDGFSGGFFIYLIVLSVFLLISLAFDIYDIATYFKQRRE